MADNNVDWETCVDSGCVGVRLPTGGKCWAHAADSDLDPALKRLGRDGRLDARGVPVAQKLLGRLLAAVPRDDHGHAILTDARFERATFQRAARFGWATFKGTAGFLGATFQGAARFERATFQGAGGFDEATFKDIAVFGKATFQRDAWFRRATFQRDVWFVAATFQGTAGFGRATFHRTARFDEARFQQARQLGPMLVRKTLQLDEAVFHERAQIEVAAAAVCCQRTRFLAGVQLRVRWAQVVLDDADLAAPSILAGAPAFQGLQEGCWARALEHLQPTGTRAGQARLLSLRRADVAGLTVAGVDMRACRFVGAHHLDQLRLEESHFASTPRGWWWTTRQTIAEEHHWRATSPHGLDMAAVDATSRGPHKAARSAGWYRPASRPPAWLEVEPPSPAQIAALYRALRKGREDNKDEPGAADFYYGEMEMRRHAKREEAKKERRDRHYRHWAAATTERAVLWLYWLVSGYGLRAWRALAALAVVIGLVGVGFSRVGFHHPHPSQVASWLYALQATVSLEGKARQLSGQLTLPGELLRVGLRFTGPVLLGLAVLSIRGRVKR